MDFSMKNNKIVNHYFTNLKERSTITPMEVIADGTGERKPSRLLSWNGLCQR